MKRPALYIHGRVVVGSSHSAAFDQLSPDERFEDSIASGIFDTETGEFLSYIEEEHFYEKEMLLIRHAETDEHGPDPGLSQDGVDQIHHLVPYLRALHLDEFVCLCSPMLRCLQTAQVIQHDMGIQFCVNPALLEAPAFLHPGENYYVAARPLAFPQFLWMEAEGWFVECYAGTEFVDHVAHVLRTLPRKSLMITHSGFVLIMAKIALCEKVVSNFRIPTASLTHISNREIRCVGRVL